VLPARLVIATRGDWREDLGARADDAIGRAAAEGRAEIARDLRATVDVDVSGLGLLVVVRQPAHDRGLAVRLLHLAPSIRELLALTRRDELFVFDE
jgi:anti-anti-sigma regulatory factor